MSPDKTAQKTGLIAEVLKAFDDLNGLHPGFRPVHAKGLLLSGIFTPALSGQALTRAPHLHRQQTPVTVRLSDFAGVPSIPDNNPDASPRGFAIRFHLAEHSHTDIVAHSVDGFPVRTAEEFAEFLRAAHASGPGARRPTPIESFLGTHPAALRFVQTPKPFPSSFAKESFFGVNAYRFTNEGGISTYGRYRIRPDGDGEYLDASAAAAKSSNYLFDEITTRIAKSPIVFRIRVQLAAQGDAVDDSTVQWPEGRPQVDFGRIELTGLTPNNNAEQRHIIFDPIPRVDGIDPSGDPLLEPRADVYLASGRRRRSAP
jgi:catalase